MENQSLGPQGEPTFARAYETLLAEWSQGNRDREVALHIAFLAWYLMLEPSHLTGLNEASPDARDLARVFGEAHDALAPSTSADPELLFVFGLMAQLSPWLLGETATWEALSVRYRQTYRELLPNGIAPEVFANRGAYGEYFDGQARVKGGY